LRSIESIELGDRVWARNELTGETTLKKVTDLIRRHERRIWTVSLTGLDGADEFFETTGDHPWWIAGQGWKTTEDISPGMAVTTRDGRGMVITAVKETARTDSTYNLTVADFETYFVGEQRVLVHNCGNFDKARADAFEDAGITDGNVKFTMEDRATGTITEFKGNNGAKVGYDGPHPGTPGPHHDRNHVSWQSGGKRGEGMQRGNQPYTGSQHPTRQDSRDIEPQ